MLCDWSGLCSTDTYEDKYRKYGKSIFIDKDRNIKKSTYDGLQNYLDKLKDK